MDKNFKHAYIYLFFDIKFTSFINKACPKKLALLLLIIHQNKTKENKRSYLCSTPKGPPNDKWFVTRGVRLKEQSKC